MTKKEITYCVTFEKNWLDAKPDKFTHKTSLEQFV